MFSLNRTHVCKTDPCKYCEREDLARKRIDKGLCRRALCSKPLHEGSTQFCREHAERRRESQSKIYAKKAQDNKNRPSNDNGGSVDGNSRTGTTVSAQNPYPSSGSSTNRDNGSNAYSSTVPPGLHTSPYQASGTPSSVFAADPNDVFNNAWGGQSGGTSYQGYIRRPTPPALPMIPNYQPSNSGVQAPDNGNPYQSLDGYDHIGSSQYSQPLPNSTPSHERQHQYNDREEYADDPWAWNTYDANYPDGDDDGQGR
ncbi:hypothetical protein F4781DRAFT_427123 [Annulohypoxylon bovei var. microspora]|nr:hypothetical protein F4781DRAFT_427123 [Annulohypoxylon bovei var. microspora]